MNDLVRLAEALCQDLRATAEASDDLELRLRLSLHYCAAKKIADEARAPKAPVFTGLRVVK